MPHCTIALQLDSVQAQADIALLTQAAKTSLRVRQRLLDLRDLAAHLVCVDADHPVALGAGQLGIRLEFSNGLAELVSAVRAGQFD